MWRWQAMERWLNDYAPKLGAEIGVKEGRFISYLLNAFPSLRMYAVDPWEQQPECNEDYLEWDFNGIYNTYKNNVFKNVNRVIELKEYSKTAAEKVADGSLDFVFIDAQHDYDSVKRDIELWQPKVREGGLLSGHDYHPKFPGVVQAVDEKFNPMKGANSIWGVKC